MSDNKILYEIQSAFDKTGTDAAERAQDRLADKTKSLNRTFQDNDRDATRARQALAGLSAASQASQGSFGGLARVLEGFSGRLADLAGKATLVAGAFSAGYGVGTAIDRWLGLSKAVADAYAPMEKVASIQDRIKAQLGDLNAASLGAVKQQFDALSESLASTMSQMDQINRIKNSLASDETEAQLAELEAGLPPGPGRDRAILAKRREREQASIEERRNQARAKFQAAESALAGGQSALLQTQSAEGDLRKQAMLLDRSDSGATLEQRSAARQRLQAAEAASAAARNRLSGLEDTHGQAVMEKSNTMRSLSFEERASRARFSAADSAITLRQQEEAAREAGRQQNIREGVTTDMLQISRTATRTAMSGQLSNLRDQQSALSGEGMRSARVADLRAKAAGTFKDTDSAVAAVAAILDQITARMKSLEDKLKNLPR
jgi:hypothetical protein